MIKISIRYSKNLWICALLCAGTYLPASAQTKSQQQINVELSASRKKIDSLDKMLIRVLGERQRVVREIGVYKKKNNVPPLQPARFKEVVDRAVAAGQKEGLSEIFIKEMMNAIHDESLRMESDTTTKQ